MVYKYILVFCFISFALVTLNAQNTFCKLDTSLCYLDKKFDSGINIQIEKKWEFTEDVVQRQLPILLDINDDCSPELITAGYENYNKDWIASSQILVFDPKGRSLKRTFSTFYFKASTQSFIVKKNSNDFEIIIAVADININPQNERGKLVCYNSDNTIKWISNQKYGGQTGQGGSLSMADFNRDGISEVFIHNNIFNAETGVLLASGGNNGIGGIGFATISIAADLDDDPSDLELAAGYSVYKVKITNQNGVLGNAITANNILINGFGRDGLTAVSDINNDQKLDIIIVTAQNLYSGIYVYTYQNNSYEIIAKIEWPIYIPLGVLSFGRLTQNGKLDILLTTTDAIKKYSYNNSILLNEDWSFAINDGSGYSGLSIFDFDNDGIQEIIYRDETELKIIDAKNNMPKTITVAKCVAQTNFEYPIIADIDGSGETKICVTCADNFNDQNGKLTIFGPPPGQKWAPARKIWHQYAYNPLFINDDGTVPQYMQNPATYKNGKYNNFMVQESLLDEDGNYNVPAASLTGTISCIDFDVATQQYTIDFSINNRADASASALTGVPVAFYNGNPESGGTLIGVYRTTADLSAGSTLSALTYSFKAPDITALFMIVNTDKYPIIVSDTSYYDIDECDYTDNVFIAPAPKFIDTVQEICQGDSYTFYGKALSASGTYYQEIPNVSGCDSVIARLDLQVSNIKMQSITTSACDTYVWNGQTYTADGTYTYQTLSVNGCDSITTLNLVVNRSDQISLNQQSCDAYTWNGQTYTQSGTYTYRAQNIHGCDSIVSLDLQVYPSADVIQSRAACESYTWNGQTYTQSGTYAYQTQTKYGCDSTITLDLTISNVLRTNHPVTACDTYLWNGQSYTTSGDYIYTGLSVQGCDSIATLQLVIHPSTTSSLVQTACEPYSWNGQIYDQSGTYTYRTPNVFGCDSIATLTLTVYRATTSTSDVNACSQYTWNGQTYTQSGSYNYKTSNSFGCDSIATLRLNISQPDAVVMPISACGSYLWNGQNYNQSGSYSFLSQNRFGCDSLTTIKLTIHNADAPKVQRTACDPIIYLGRTLTQSGIYTFDLQNQYGCDSIITLELTISGNKSSTTQSACSSYLWPINGQTYTQSGIYTERYTNVLGCDSTYTLDLIIHPEYEVRTAAEACAQYVWPVTQQRYTQSGTYNLPLKSAQGCDSTVTLDLMIYPEFEFRDTVVSEEPYLWPINNETYENSGVYTQSFSTDVSCDSVHYLYLTIKNSTEIFFPNIISTDGANGFFTGYSNNASVMINSLAVYDRWGNLMFSKENFPVNDPQQGWNGKISGREVVPGVYIWLAVVQLKDGNLETYSGDVTVVR